jgi:hypothetical protein
MGCGSSAGRRGAGDGAVARRGRARGAAGRGAAGRAADRCRAGRPDRLPGPRCDRRAGRSAPQRERRTQRFPVIRRDDPRPAGGRRGPGRRGDRRLARPRSRARPGRGRRPRGPPRLARRRDTGDPRRGPVDRGGPPRRPLGRRPRHRSAAAAAGRHDPGEGRRADPPARRSRPPGGDAPRRDRAAGVDRRPRDRRRRIDRAPPRARPPLVDPARARRRRPADRGAGGPEPLRAAGETGGSPDPLRRGR